VKQGEKTPTSDCLNFFNHSRLKHFFAMYPQIDFETILITEFENCFMLNYLLKHILIVLLVLSLIFGQFSSIILRI